MSFQNVELPNSLDAEQTLLGAVILDNSLMDIVSSKIKKEYFYDERNLKIYEVILDQYLRSVHIDAAVVSAEVTNFGVFESNQEARNYIGKIVKETPTSASESVAEQYCDILSKKYYMRCIIELSNDMEETVTNIGGKSIKEVLGDFEQKISELRQGQESSGLVPINKSLFNEFQPYILDISSSDASNFTGLSTGFSDLDNIISGLRKSDMIIVAARPGMGKSAFAFNIAVNVAKKESQNKKQNQKKVAIFSLEMSRLQIVTRIMAAEAGVSNTRLNNGQLKGDDMEKIIDTFEFVVGYPIAINDKAGMTVPEMKASLKNEENLGLVIIDYIQLIESASKYGNRVNEISEITRQIKIMAKDLDVPVIALSQLSRSVEKRDDKRPIMSDLRDSGSIEQDADIIMFLYRDEYYSKDKEGDDDSKIQSTAQCIVAKNRHGKTGTAELAWVGEYTQFRSLDHNPTHNII